MRIDKEGTTILNHLSIDACSKNKIQIRPVNSRKHLYISAQYDNNTLCYDDSENGMYRSVLLTYPDKKVLSFAIPKTIPFHHFHTTYPDWNDDIYVSEYIEGIAVQLFYDPRIAQWEIATNNNVGGYQREYLNNKSIHIRKGFVHALGGDTKDDINNLPFLHNLPKHMSYSFVLNSNDAIQTSYEIYMVGVYSISDTNSITYIALPQVESWEELVNVHGLIQFPQTVSIFGYFHLSEKLTEVDSKKWVITNTETGVMCIVENEERRYQEDIRKISHKTQYHYQCLSRINQLDPFLEHFPKQAKQFKLARDLFKRFIANIYAAYRCYYIQKCINVIPDRYKYHVINIHKQIYIPSLRNKRPIMINRERIHEYFQKIDPREIVNCMRT